MGGSFYLQELTQSPTHKRDSKIFKKYQYLRKTNTVNLKKDPKSLQFITNETIRNQRDTF